MKRKLQYGLKKTVSWMLSLVLVSGLFTLAWPLDAAAATPSWTGTGSSAPYFVSSMVELNGTIYAGSKDNSGMWTCSNGAWTPVSGSPSTITSMVKGTGNEIYVSYVQAPTGGPTISSYNCTSGTWTAMGNPSNYVFCLQAIKGQNNDPDMIYAATADGWYKCAAGQSVWTTITTECTRSIMEVGGMLYARTNDYVYSYRLINSTWTLTKICNYGNTDEIPQTFAYIDGTLYFRDDLGVYSYTTDSNGTTSCAIMTGSPDNVLAFAEINGTLYAGADDGLYTYSGGSSGTWSKIPGSPNFVQSMLYSNGTLYAGTIGMDGATWRCSNGVWTIAAPGKINAIQAIGNAVYAGTDIAVWCYSNGSWAQMSGSPAKVTCMQNVDGTLYAGAYDGVWSYSGGTWTKMSGSPGYVTCMLSNAIGRLNVGTSDGQLWSYIDSSGLGSWTWRMLADKVEIIPDNNAAPIYDISAMNITSLVYIDKWIYVGGYSSTGIGGDVWQYYNYKLHRLNNSEPVNVDSVVGINVYPCAVASNYFWSYSGGPWLKRSDWPTMSKATNMGGTVYAWGNKVWRYNGGSWTELSGAPTGVNCMAYINGTPYAGANGLYLYTAPSAPTIGSQPADRTVTAGDAAAFTVAAASNDGWLLSYQWQKSTDGGGTWSNVADGAGANTDSYTTGTLSTSDSGAKYRCVVTDAISGSVTSNPAALTVVGIPPTISPASRHYDLNAPADVTTVITWNSAASVTNMVYTVSPDTTHYTLASGDYTVSGNNLTVKNSFLSGLSLTSGAAIDFDITFNTGVLATLTVDVVNGYTPGSNANLGSLSVNGTPVSGFDPNNTDYAVELPNGTASATVTATAIDSHAQVSITQGSSLPGPATVTVTAEDGTTTKTYSINLTVASGSGNGGGGGGGGGGGSTPIETTEIKTTVSGNTATVNIPKAALEQAADGKDGLKLSTPVASLSFDTAATSTIFGKAAADVKITASKADTASLSAETKQLVGDRPVFDFSVTSGNNTISQFGGNVTVSVPYTPKEGEDADAIVIYYINPEGKPEAVSNCHYEKATGKVTFTTNHFSQYAVGYNKVSFGDVKAGAWYENAVDFAAARGIVTGTGNGNFDPNGNLTRAQLLVMLMRAYGIEPDKDLSGNFSDAGNTYYTGYLAAAKRLGITEGLGNNLYAPDKQITRQEMFTLLYNTLKVIGQLPEGTGKASGALTGYSDADSVASWAKDAAGMLADAGIVGGSNGKLFSKNTTTRAEMAQVLYNLLSR